MLCCGDYMTIAGWMLLAAGLIAMPYGWFIGWRSAGKPMMLLGSTNFALGATFLLNRNGGLFGWVALGVLVLYLVGVIVMSRRESFGFKPRSG